VLFGDGDLGTDDAPIDATSQEQYWTCGNITPKLIADQFDDFGV
jgi:hypothetical protein